MDEVVVSERKMGTIASRTSVLQTQKITYDEICRAACCNLAESFETNPSVDVSYSDAATGARQIKLLGLAGTYVQMLTENYPNFRGAASLYGLDYVPVSYTHLDVYKRQEYGTERKSRLRCGIDTEEKRGYRESGVANREIFKFPGSYHGYF